MLAATSLMSRRTEPPRHRMRAEWTPLFIMTRCSEPVLLHPLIRRSTLLRNIMPGYYQPAGLRRRLTIYRQYMKQVSACSMSRNRSLTCDRRRKGSATKEPVRPPFRALLPQPPR